MLVIAITTIYLLFNSPFSPRNLAAEVAAPLESALVKAGAVKKCSNGDPGFGPDNWEPWHEGVYQIEMSRGGAIELVKRIGKDSGYNLRTTSSNTDLSAEVNLNDQTSKKNPYDELKDGSVYMSGIIDGVGEDHRCKGEVLLTNERQTVIRINSTLPTRKVTR